MKLKIALTLIAMLIAPITQTKTEQTELLKMGAMAHHSNMVHQTHAAYHAQPKPVVTTTATVANCTLNLSNRCLTTLCPFPPFCGNPQQVKTLLLYQNKLCFLAENTFKIFCSLEKLDLSCNTIAKIDWGAFQYTKLEQLNLSKNQLCSISKGTFADLGCLRALNLSNNKIKKIKSEAWYGLKKLQTLILSHNKLECLYNDMFCSLKHLKKLDLSCNQIKSVEDGAFNSLEKIEVICLDHNKLSYLSSVPFQNLTNLAVLKVGHNKLCQSNIDQLRADLPNVDVQGKGSTTGNCSACDTTITIVDGTVDLSNKGLTSLNVLNTICTPENVTTLLLNNNALTTVCKKAFKRFINLKSVNLNANQITSINEEALCGVGKLNDFSINNNKLTSVPCKLFCPTPYVKTADFSVNSITSVSEKFFNCTPALTTINFTSNPLNDATKQMFTKVSADRGITILY